jgi:fused signal recognition particle receptor
MLSFFKKLQQGLGKQTPTFQKAFAKVFGGAKLDPVALDELEGVLYEADFGVQTVEDLLTAIQEAYKNDKSLRADGAAAIGCRVLQDILKNSEGRLTDDIGKPQVITLLGVNGSGKTTTAAKIAHHLQQQGKSVLLGACDTFRAAANEQLKTWSERLNVQLVASQHGADAAAVAYDAHAAAISRGSDCLVIDTAGRLHTKHNLMEELGKLRRVLQKQDPCAPHHAWLVVDGSLGSNSIEQARVFNQKFPLTGLIVTKLDGTSRGGALVGIHRALQLPIYFVGLGEQADDLQVFSAAAYSRAIFGLGDTDSLNP